jgi:hypothetical protein
MLFAAIWMMSSLSPVMGDTEIMQFHASRVEGGVKGVRDVVMLHEEISYVPFLFLSPRLLLKSS